MGGPLDAHGQPLPGAEVQPVLTRSYLYWIQASVDVHHVTGGPYGSEFMQYDFATGRTRRLYDGLVTALVPYHHDVLFVAAPPGPAPNNNPNAPNNPPQIVRAINQRTGVEVPAPAGLDAGPSLPFQMITNGDLIAWDTWTGGLRAWRPAWGRTKTLLPSLAARPPGLRGLSTPQDFSIHRDLLFFSDLKTYVLDLRTDSMTALSSRDGRSYAGPGSYLGMWQDANHPRPIVHGEIDYSAYLVNLAHLPDLPSCPG